jgi:hypothetical protein
MLGVPVWYQTLVNWIPAAAYSCLNCCGAHVRASLGDQMLPLVSMVTPRSLRLVTV